MPVSFSRLLDDISMRLVSKSTSDPSIILASIASGSLTSTTIVPTTIATTTKMSSTTVSPFVGSFGLSQEQSNQSSEWWKFFMDQVDEVLEGIIGVLLFGAVAYVVKRFKRSQPSPTTAIERPFVRSISLP